MSNGGRNVIYPAQERRMPQTHVNVSGLYAALDAVREHKNLSWRQLAREVGVSPSTFSRLANKQKPDVDAFVAMVRWLNVPAERFMTDGEEASSEQPDLMAELAPLLRARKDLNSDDRKYLEELVGSAMRRFTAERASRDE
jgi:transcriptional regulator with XRE-family HTH domain